MSIPSNPRTGQDDDFELIQAINAGQSELFPELLRRYERKLYNFGMRMCGDVRDTEDMVQETFINVFNYLKDFRYETRFKNWLYRIATGACLKHKRKSKYAPEKELSLEEFIPGENAGIPQQAPGWASIPLEQLLNEELSGVIQEGIASLPEKFRLVLVLRDMEGFSTAETAQVLGLTADNIKVRLHRARLFLREKLKAYYDDVT
ncbi:MAG: RNA polymerase sigma factor [Pseudomonadota bacterium]